MPAPTSAAGAAEGGPPRTELQELQLKAGQTTDESLESTRRMLALCEEVSLSLSAFVPSFYLRIDPSILSRSSSRIPRRCTIPIFFYESNPV
ncbi:Synaptosomal-associated protein 25 [Atta colombica]|uniref:Synaptosomal-associated protein 25 n=1 Tax=Atta colombica TaxID=520822 RepID=A0A195AWY9_9HYME|nr:Synaptosomal-associated protein 25 [Atta colombica]